jgi:hypothetical protein
VNAAAAKLAPNTGKLKLSKLSGELLRHTGRGTFHLRQREAVRLACGRQVTPAFEAVSEMPGLLIPRCQTCFSRAPLPHDSSEDDA